MKMTQRISREESRIVAIGMFLLLVSTTARAGLLDVRVDLGGSANTPAGWNTIENPTDTSTVHTLDNFDGSSSGISLQITDAFGQSGMNVGPFSWSNPEGSWIDVNVLYDYAYLNGGNVGQITLSGMAAGDTYQVEMLAIRTASSLTGGETYRVNNEAGMVVDGGGAATYWDGTVNGYNNQDFMRWDNAIANSTGRIVIDVAHGSATNAHAFINGLRISAVPEPSSLMLISLLLVLGTGIRWCRRANGRSDK